MAGLPAGLARDFRAALKPLTAGERLEFPTLLESLRQAALGTERETAVITEAAHAGQKFVTSGTDTEYLAETAENASVPQTVPFGTQSPETEHLELSPSLLGGNTTQQNLLYPAANTAFPPTAVLTEANSVPGVPKWESNFGETIEDDLEPETEDETEAAPPAKLPSFGGFMPHRSYQRLALEKPPGILCGSRGFVARTRLFAACPGGVGNGGRAVVVAGQSGGFFAKLAAGQGLWHRHVAPGALSGGIHRHSFGLRAAVERTDAFRRQANCACRLASLVDAAFRRGFAVGCLPGAGGGLYGLIFALLSWNLGLGNPESGLSSGAVPSRGRGRTLALSARYATIARCSRTCATPPLNGSG